jgi:hypothetical protein
MFPNLLVIQTITSKGDNIQNDNAETSHSYHLKERETHPSVSLLCPMLPHRRDKGHKWTLVTSISLYHRIDASIDDRIVLNEQKHFKANGCKKKKTIQKIFCSDRKNEFHMI